LFVKGSLWQSLQKPNKKSKDIGITVALKISK